MSNVIYHITDSFILVDLVVTDRQITQVQQCRRQTVKQALNTNSRHDGWPPFWMLTAGLDC